MVIGSLIKRTLGVATLCLFGATALAGCGNKEGEASPDKVNTFQNEGKRNAASQAEMYKKRAQQGQSAPR